MILVANRPNLGVSFLKLAEPRSQIYSLQALAMFWTDSWMLLATGAVGSYDIVLGNRSRSAYVRTNSLPPASSEMMFCINQKCTSMMHRSFGR